MGSSAGTSRTISCSAGDFTGRVEDHYVTFDPVVYAHAEPFGVDYGHGEPLPMSITIPQQATALSDLPVVVIVHGGRYEEGSYDESWIIGAGDTLTAAGFIVVSVEYRLQLAGFVPFVDDEAAHFRGVDDVAQALNWLQGNIESFGGDPTNITLVGHSAGAGIALWLSRKDHYQGTFRRVVAMSPAFPRMAFKRRKATLRRALGKPVTRKALSKLGPKKLAKGFRRYSRRVYTDLAVGPAPYDPYELNDLPILITCTREEMLRMPLAKKLDLGWYSPIAFSLLRGALGANSTWSPPFIARRCGYLVGDSLIRRFVLSTAEARAHSTWVVEYRGTPDNPIGHCDDIAWLFRLNQETHPIHNEFLRFIRGERLSWPEYGVSKTAQVYHLDFSAEQLADPLRYLWEGLK